MGRIQSKFKQLRKEKKKALITFITAGDPTLSTTEKLIHILEKSGADLLELGVPFSDPMADGPTIQRSSERALRSKTNLKLILNLVKKIRKKLEIPIILMGYYNPILQFGIDKFCKEAKQSGVDGLIVVDLPPEESLELQKPAQKAGIDFIYLLTPTADQKRIEKVRKLASGFLYYVSLTGITGGKLQDFNFIRNHIQKIRRSISLPICVGFGIRTPEQAKKIASFADGVVIGSSLVSLLEEKKKRAGSFLSQFVKKMKQAI